MTSDELIESLPSDLRPWGRLWLPVLLRWSQENLADFLMNAAGMPWDAAYRKIVRSMSTAEKVRELEIRRESLGKLNQQNAEFVTEQRRLFFSLLAKVLQTLVE